VRRLVRRDWLAPKRKAPMIYRVGNLEFRFTPYRPKISSDASAQRYFDFIYPADDATFKHKPMLSAVEVDWYLYRDFGLLGASFGIGYWHVSAPTRSCVNAANNAVECNPQTVLNSQPGNDTTTLSMVPLSLGVVYRFDLAKRAWRIPFVPYAKAGVDYWLWWNSKAGNTSHGANGSGKGGTIGYHAAAGIGLNLDWIDPTAAGLGRRSDFTGVYLFGEYSVNVANGFGQANRLDASANMVWAGLALDIR